MEKHHLWRIIEKFQFQGVQPDTIELLLMSYQESGEITIYPTGQRDKAVGTIRLKGYWVDGIGQNSKFKLIGEWSERNDTLVTDGFHQGYFYFNGLEFAHLEELDEEKLNFFIYEVSSINKKEKYDIFFKRI